MEEEEEWRGFEVTKPNMEESPGDIDTEAQLSRKAAQKAEIKAQKRQKQRGGSLCTNGIQTASISNPFEPLDGAIEEESDGMSMCCK